ncbi:MAG: hypothetical protein AAFO82_11760 [Bacteroidota bacterium]
MRRQFRKYERIALLHEMNEQHAEGVTLLVQHLEEEKEIIVGKLKSVDRISAAFLGIERNGEVHEIDYTYPKMIYTTEDVRKYLLTLIDMIQSL